ncbi:DUF2309 domain-containing protein [Halochromatium glycolicum]|uniref:Probable inorganic carbon transporter subunit DabA n=2 Tax=Halochromatium glycolicum TaxID=85075 RepID=A0AAJ0XCI8_9GAMM|nr:DUF2309 domain-containing protein [Halochromatium glycolicum]
MQDNRIDDQTLERQPVGTNADGIPSLSTAPANPPEPTPAPLPEQIDAACNRIAPVWPLDRFVAVNPFHGLRDQRFEQAAETMRRIAGARMYMPRSYYREQIEAGRITDADLDAAAARCGSDLSAAELRQAAAVDATPPSASPAATQAAPQAASQSATLSAPLSAQVPLLTSVLDELDADDWSSFVVERISHHCAAYFDMGQATWKRPWQGMSLYESWRRFAAMDYSTTMMGQGGMRARVKALPESPRDCIESAIRRLGIPAGAALDYMHAALMDIGGWAAWTRLLRWEQELTGGEDETIVELLAIRLAWDVLVYEHKASPELSKRWREVCKRLSRGKPAAKPTPEPQHIEHILLTAFELSYQRQLMADLRNGADTNGANGERPSTQRPVIQAAFCIDVRSEVMRRAFETICPKAQTLGFAGFFGVPIEHVPFGAVEPRSHMPVLLTPTYRVCSEVHDADRDEAEQALETQRRRTGISKSWKAFKMGASSCFSFVEAAGLLLYAPKIIADSFGWGRPVAAPDDLHLDAPQQQRVGPSLDVPNHGACSREGLVTPGSSYGSADGSAHEPVHQHQHDHGQAQGAIPGGEQAESPAQAPSARTPGIPEAERVDLAEGILRAMSMTDNFARLVLLVGHGSTVVNNPHATGLDCGACGGMTGEASARVGAALLNDPKVRRGVAERGIRIPDDTWFIGAQHDTCVDEIRLYDTAVLPGEYAEELAQLRSWLQQAGELTRLSRAALLGLEHRSRQAITANIRHRSRDWSQVRPEWGLAGCAAFIAAPRERTRGLDLGGRTFLHDYDWTGDTGFGVLELIMTAPMVVAAWINLQYYGSTTDNRRFGSGNKVLHNVVGGAIGVLEGNAGDLRVGLPMQSLHDGKRWVHEPMRLSVYLQAPQAPIDDIIAKHQLVQEMLDNGWMHLFRMDDEGGIQQRIPHEGWQAVPSH